MSAIKLNTINAPAAGLGVASGVVKSAANELSGRYFLSSNFAGSPSNWLYMGANWGLATDIPPNVNSTISATPDPTKVGLVTQSGNVLIYIPKSGKYNISFFGVTNGLSASNSGELRLCTYSSPAWPQTNQVARSYGVGATANALATSAPAWLCVTSLNSFGSELGPCSFSGILAAGTLIAPLFYNGGTNVTTLVTAFIQINCDYVLS